MLNVKVRRSTMAEMARSEITINLGALRRNVTHLSAVAEGSELWAVVKANAYGHGAADCGDTALAAGALAVGVTWGYRPEAELRDAGAQAPHRPYNAYVAPFHFYRLEFVRLDGDDIQKHWREWYPTAAQPGPAVPDLKPGPALGANFSAEWPYPIAYDSVRAAPNNYRLLYEDGKMRLLEVVIRPGQES